ncbi:MAG TPA: hypothetical protein VK950_00930, partial [Methylophilus sp.]|nr:hypothetical protein [Methylophilus sp.]
SNSSKSNFFLFFAAVERDAVQNYTQAKACAFYGPYLTRRVAQATWVPSASICVSSAVACVLCKPLGRVMLDAYVDEQRRKQAEARVPFLLVTYSLGKQRKVTRCESEKQRRMTEEISIKPTKN